MRVANGQRWQTALTGHASLWQWRGASPIRLHPISREMAGCNGQVVEKRV
jgi:hypothetical protein